MTAAAMIEAAELFMGDGMEAGDLAACSERYFPFQVQGDGMVSHPPRRGDIAPGDWIILDTQDRRPSSGVFVICDGFGLDVVRIEGRPGGMVHVWRNNGDYTPYDARPSDVDIVGRVVARMEQIG